MGSSYFLPPAHHTCFHLPAYPLLTPPCSPLYPQVKFSADHSIFGAMQSMETEVVYFTGGAVLVTEQVRGGGGTSREERCA